MLPLTSHSNKHQLLLNHQRSWFPYNWCQPHATEETQALTPAPTKEEPSEPTPAPLARTEDSEVPTPAPANEEPGKPTPAPSAPTKDSEVPTPAPTNEESGKPTTAEESSLCIEVSVEGDATYCIQGPVCSGFDDGPAETTVLSEVTWLSKTALKRFRVGSVLAPAWRQWMPNNYCAASSAAIGVGSVAAIVAGVGAIVAIAGFTAYNYRQNRATRHDFENNIVAPVTSPA
ncbi:uncharacterized protein PITG_19930 [Phytophthora infestans T30-4]|uniref:Uncharacterized protein n=1 Tax=Phytophthora infestans (strain T30-4) TaxID=403677 RepID=D0P1T7_PHYIT|nr:uncharacterized protein PITG_19930 [Phytophthora infestans T30-4]EEY55070.1 conserved hypothetical protein [Phytophthora infestans T30-4]|eukprot:XP_002895729.1 conserved hypothetical protein [Phytophthora infestans T30-4]